MRRKQPTPPCLQGYRERQARKIQEHAAAHASKGRLHEFSDWLADWHIIRIFQALSSFLLLLTLIAFCQDQDVRKEERDAKQYGRKIDAWQIISTKASDNSGKRQALEYLHKAGEPLIGIDFSVAEDQSGAYLRGLELPKADLRTADLSGAKLWIADLSGANLEEADLDKADLRAARLNASEPCAQLKEAKNWQQAYRKSYCQMWCMEIMQSPVDESPFLSLHR